MWLQGELIINEDLNVYEITKAAVEVRRVYNEAGRIKTLCWMAGGCESLARSSFAAQAELPARPWEAPMVPQGHSPGAIHT